MGTINWTKFDGDKFQSFCNDLLSFEFGKSYVPFSAPGSDQGIDGLFEGEYDENHGKWRFQAKFRSPESGRQASINNLKSEIKKDLDKNIRDETHVIFITNVDIGPKQQKELIDEANKITANRIVFEIWDGAKLNTLLSHHPIVKSWYTNETKYLIQEYSDFFKDELNSDNKASYELSNRYYYREEKIKELANFISDDSKKVAIISGEAGIGKTRLCIEFFQKHIDNRKDWVGLVIINHKIDLEVLQKALIGEKNYVVLIDDADKFDQRELADLITTVKGFKENNVKLLLTVRSYFLEALLNEINITDRTQQIKYIELTQLSREETVHFLEGELNGYQIEKYLGYFVELTHGVPIMIMTLLKVIKDGTPLANIKKDAFLKTYVKMHFANFSSVVSKDAEIHKRSIDKVVKLITLIEPVQIEDNVLIQQIASTENVIEEEVELILQALQDQNILSGRYLKMIKPDIYSDLILEEALTNKNWLKLKLPEYGGFINNIIKNIGYVYQHDENNTVLENLLIEYVARIDTCSKNVILAKTLETIDSITYSMPLLASNAIGKVLSIYSNENHPLFDEFQKSVKHKNYSFDTVINNLKNILKKLFELEDYYEYSYTYSGKLYLILNDDGIVSNIANFGKSDRFDGFNCIKQNRIFVASKNELEKENSNFKFFALKTLNSILKLEYTDTESHLYQKHSIQIYTLYIPENEYVTILRKQAIELLIGVFHNTLDTNLREEVFRIIIDIPREILANRNKTYKGKIEVKIVLDFLFKISTGNVLELKQKQFVKDQLYWFKRWGINETFNLIIEEIVINLSDNDLAETLLDLFNPKFDGKLNDENEKFKIKSIELINNNSGIELGDALVKVIDQSEYIPHNFYPFLHSISSNSSKIKEFIEYLWSKNKSFIIDHCSDILRQLRFSKKDENFYWKYINSLKKEETFKANNCILNVYNSLGIHNMINKYGSRKILKPKDIDEIVLLHENSKVENYFNLALTLPTLFFYDKEIAQNEIKNFLKVCNENHLDRMFLAFDPIEEECFSEIKNLLFEHTIHLNIPYTVERFLNKIILLDGFQEVLNYLEKRFLFKREYIKNKKSLLGYEYVPNHRSNVITKNLSDKQKTESFADVLNWFVSMNFESYEHFYVKNIIDLFKTNKYINDTTKTTYIKLIDEYSLSYDRLLNIIHSLSVFEQKNEAFVDLIVKLLELCNENFYDDKQIGEFNSQCYIALTNVGVKSGSPGQPFSVDLELKELLENTLGKAKLSSPKVKDFFIKVLKSVQSNIDRDRDEEGGELW
ncbi:ATP-binding protein [Mariniflexile sp. HNIBRBA6329]|uniref:ATP-binding protein n=1 Tax=Mariniflexile sp. HNIBRBA6329 TaxID=3373088 RepID=UPI003745C64B